MITTLVIKQRRESYLPSVSNEIAYRIITYIESVTNDSGGSSTLTKNLFLCKKRSEMDEYISQSDFLRVATAEDFSVLDYDEATNVGIDTYNGVRVTWEDLQNNNWISSHNVAYPELSLAAPGTSPSGYYIGSTLVRSFDNIADADLHAENIIIILEQFVKRYNLLDDVFESNTPTGYEEIIYS